MRREWGLPQLKTPMWGLGLKHQHLPLSCVKHLHYLV